MILSPFSQLKEQNCASTLRLKSLKDEVESSDSIASTDAVMVKVCDDDDQQLHDIYYELYMYISYVPSIIFWCHAVERPKCKVGLRYAKAEDFELASSIRHQSNHFELTYNADFRSNILLFNIQVQSEQIAHYDQYVRPWILLPRLFYVYTFSSSVSIPLDFLNLADID